MDCGVKAAADGICLPVKVYLGHVHNLVEKGVDCLFIPYIISVETKAYICPKFMGLPDIVRNCINDLPPLLSPTIDGRKGVRRIMKAYLKLGCSLAPVDKVFHACRRAFANQSRCEQQLIQPENQLQHNMGGMVVAVLGHEYLLHDDFLSMGIVKRLRRAGCRVVTAEQIDPNIIAVNHQFLKKSMYWTSGKRILGAANHLLAKVDGIVSVMSFACGTDSITTDLVDRYCHRNQKPHLVISLDEHTGQTGVLTRIEAFLDLLQRGKQHENHLSPYGKPLFSH
jgi:predicted nucleotide-binding protein (sugar kinase/HSP70/actin superfamily)